MRKLLIIVAAFLTCVFQVNAQLQSLNSLSELDVTATAVQFKNVATGQYIVLKADPRGGGSLEGSAAAEPTPWYFYQASNATGGNVEVKRKPVDGFHWSNYAQRTDEGSSIAWNHATRIPNATAPNGPHAWMIEEVSQGVFRIKWTYNNEYMELMPNLKLPGSNGPKIITRPLDAANKHQQWTIEVNKKKGTATPSVVSTWTFDAGGGSLATITFKADKTGTMEMGGNTDSFVYENPDAKTLIITPSGSTPETNEIVSLTATTMVIKDTSGSLITLTRK